MSVLIYLVILIFSTIFGSYSFKTVAEDYQSIVFSMIDDPFPQDIIIDKLLPFPNKSKILNAVDFENQGSRFCINGHHKVF